MLSSKGRVVGGGGDSRGKETTIPKYLQSTGVSTSLFQTGGHTVGMPMDQVPSRHVFMLCTF